MNRELMTGLIPLFAVIIASYPLGRHLAKVYKGEKNWMSFMSPIERFIYKLAGIDPKEEMTWKHFLRSLLICNLFWFFWGILLLLIQGILPLNPDGNSGQ